MELNIYNAYGREALLTEDQLFSRMEELNCWYERVSTLFNLVERDQRSPHEIRMFEAFEKYFSLLWQTSLEALQSKLAARLQKLPIEEIDSELQLWKDDPKFQWVFDRAVLTSKQHPLGPTAEDHDALAVWMEYIALDAWYLDPESKFWPIVSADTIRARRNVSALTDIWLEDDSSLLDGEGAGDSPADGGLTILPGSSELARSKRQVPKPISRQTPFAKMVAIKLLEHDPQPSVFRYITVAKWISIDDRFLPEEYREAAALKKVDIKKVDQLLLVDDDLREKFTKYVSFVWGLLENTHR